MKFKIDENLPIDFAAVLCEAGHEASTVGEQRMGGAGDAAVARACSAEERILLTLDMDFSDVRVYPPGNYPGLVVFRLRDQDKPTLMQLLQRFLSLVATHPIEHRLWIVEEAQVRIRNGE